MTIEKAEILRALVVDLDDSLICTDSFLEQALDLLRQRPLAILRIAAGLRNGRAGLKAAVTDENPPTAEDMPYHEDLVAFLRDEHANGRRIILATAADQRVANAVADQLGIFEAVLATTPERNLKGVEKASAIAEYLGNEAFDYVGDCAADQPIWQAAGRAHVVTADPKIAQKLAGSVPVHRVFERAGLTPRVMLKAMRVHQWAKNVLIFVPLILSHAYDEPQRVMATVLAFFCLGLCASGTYLWNDLLDLADDRAHPTKRNRPLASGTMKIRQGVVTSFLLIAIALSLAGLFHGPVLMLGLLAYIVLTLSYSLLIKRKLAADVILLALLFLFRILLGGAAAGIVVSEWLLAFSIFFFLSLGFAKRLADLPPDTRNDPSLIPGRAYRGTDAPILAILGAGAGLSSIIIMSLYINETAVEMLYRTPQVLWGICLVLLYWQSRLWILAYRGELPHDPIIFVLKDRISQLLGCIIIVTVILARVNLFG